MKNLINKRSLVVWAFISIFYGLYLYRPLPDGVAEPWKTRQIVTMLHLMHDVAYLGEKLGIGTIAEMNRYLTDSSATMVRFRWFNTVKVTDTDFSGVKVRVYEPEGIKANNPGLIFFHGGGWIFGSIETHDHVTMALAEHLQIVVVSVDYRLAPEHPYPTPLQDCLKATLHFMENAGEFGVDPSRIAVVGDSAGGNLAAAVTLKLHHESNQHQPRLQALIYPALQMFDFNLPAYVNNDDAVYGTRDALAATMLFYMGHDLTHLTEVTANNHTSPQMRAEHGALVCTSMLPTEYTQNFTETSEGIGNWELFQKIGHRALDPYFMPLMAQNLTGLPKSYVITAGYDVLRDDGILYAKRLQRDGVPVTWKHYSGAYHGFLAFIEEPIKTQIGLRAMADLVQYLKQEL